MAGFWYLLFIIIMEDSCEVLSGRGNSDVQLPPELEELEELLLLELLLLKV